MFGLNTNTLTININQYVVEKFGLRIRNQNALNLLLQTLSVTFLFSSVDN